MAGRWGISRGVFARWNDLAANDSDNSPDRAFRALWKASERESGDWVTLWDTEARPKAPRPYVVFQQGEPTLVGGMSSKLAGKQNALYDVPVQFVVYAFTKEDAQTLAAVVMGAFEEHGFWDCAPDKVANITRIGDNPVREGDRQWSWMIRYTVRVDAQETNIGAA